MSAAESSAESTAPATRSARHARRAGRSGRPDAAGLGLRAERVECAELAAYSVNKLFVHRLLGVPGTLIAEPTAPAPRNIRERITGWNYWWQAHLLDAFVDAGHRCLSLGRTSDAKRWVEQGTRLLRGIRWHNFGTYRNDFYDDMAWLALAAERLNGLSHAVTGRGCPNAQEAGRALYPQFEQAHTPEAGGGVFWNKSENFKNTPANGPIALAWARAGQAQKARELLDWLKESLWDPQKGYLDGLRLELQRDGSREPRVEGAEFSYNQGIVLGALLGTPGADLEHAEELIRVVRDRYAQTVELDGQSITCLRTHGTGDAGLFTGILARYLAEAAQDERLSEQTRETARELVLSTADLLWDGRREFDPDLPLNELGVDVNEIRGQAVAVFSTDPGRAASETLGAGARVQLSAQVQAWTILEAAYRLS